MFLLRLSTPQIRVLCTQMGCEALYQPRSTAQVLFLFKISSFGSSAKGRATLSSWGFEPQRRKCIKLTLPPRHPLLHDYSDDGMAEVHLAPRASSLDC